MTIQTKERGFVLLPILFSVIFLIIGCQKMDIAPSENSVYYGIEDKNISTAHFHFYLQQLSVEEINLLLTAAYEDPYLHPYLRDYLLGEVTITFEKVLTNCFTEWQQKACGKKKAQLCEVIGQVLANSSMRFREV